MSVSRKIHVRRLKVSASIGILAHELTTHQTVYFDVELDLLPDSLKPEAVQIADVLDYRSVRNIVQQEAQTGHVYLVEALVDRIVLRLLGMPNVQSVRVGAFKPEAFDDCQEVGVSVFAIVQGNLP
jgi:7,8-dihydroneopterin aldolase/epimerase/oxygenase